MNRIEASDSAMATGKAQAARPIQGSPAEVDQSTAVDDPTIVLGRRGYRSFYVSDAVFARFRAAIHWTSRRPEAVERVPENMSTAIEQYMDQVATELEREYNDGRYFPPTPRQRRSRHMRPG